MDFETQLHEQLTELGGQTAPVAEIDLDLAMDAGQRRLAHRQAARAGLGTTAGIAVVALAVAAIGLGKSPRSGPAEAAAGGAPSATATARATAAASSASSGSSASGPTLANAMPFHVNLPFPQGFKVTSDAFTPPGPQGFSTTSWETDFRLSAPDGSLGIMISVYLPTPPDQQTYPAKPTSGAGMQVGVNGKPSMDCFDETVQGGQVTCQGNSTGYVILGDEVNGLEFEIEVSTSAFPYINSVCGIKSFFDAFDWLGTDQSAWTKHVFN